MSDKKEIYVMSGNDLYYKATIKKTDVQLNYSKEEGWSDKIKGKKIGTLKDDGNAVKIDIGNLKVDLEYDELVELYVLLDLKFKIDAQMTAELKYLSEKIV